MVNPTPAPTTRPSRARRSVSRRRARTSPDVFDYLDRDVPGGFPEYPYNYYLQEPERNYGGYTVYPSPLPAAAFPIPPPPKDEANASNSGGGAGGLLGSLANPLLRFWNGSGSAEDTTPPKAVPTQKKKPLAPAHVPARRRSPPPPPPPPHRQQHTDSRRTLSYFGAPANSRALVPVPKPTPAGGGGGGIFSYLPALPSMPAMPAMPAMPSLPVFTLPNIPLPSILQSTPEAPPQLSPEALDTIVRYLALYTQHTLNAESTSFTRKAKRYAERLILGMSPDAIGNLHEFLVTIRRVPDTPVVFDPSMLERYTMGDPEAFTVLAEGLTSVLRGLAGVLEGGFTVPGGWVEDDGAE